jgi:cytidylate kinase
MAVITISRELGSGGLEIAQQVARALGYEFVDKRTTDQVFRQYGLTKFDDLYSSVPSFLDLLNADNLLLIAMANEIIEAVAKRGNVVILGRAGFVVLAEYADVLHVRLNAPFAERVQRVMAREQLSDLAAAEERVREDDTIHRTYIQRFYNTEWDAPASFALNLDTGALAYDAAVQQIVAATRALEQKLPEGAAATTATIAVDPVLAETVAEAIAQPAPDLPS